MEPPARNRIETGDRRITFSGRRNGMNDTAPACDGGMHKNAMAAT